MTAAVPLERVLDKVAEATRAEVGNALKEGYDDAVKVVGEAEQQLLRETQQIISSKMREAATKKTRMVSSNELLYRNKRLELMEDTIEKAFVEALARLRKKSVDAAYEKSLLNFLRQGVKAVGAKEVEVVANARELPVLRKVTKSAESELRVKISVSDKPINCSGGIIIRTSDGSTVYDNTLEARLARLRPLLKKQLSELFRKG